MCSTFHKNEHCFEHNATRVVLSVLGAASKDKKSSLYILCTFFLYNAELGCVSNGCEFKF